MLTQIPYLALLGRERRGRPRESAQHEALVFWHDSIEKVNRVVFAQINDFSPLGFQITHRSQLPSDQALGLIAGDDCFNVAMVWTMQDGNLHTSGLRIISKRAAEMSRLAAGNG